MMALPFTPALLAVVVSFGSIIAAEGAAAPEDHISYLDNGVIRLGVNLDLGGAITYVSASPSASTPATEAEIGPSRLNIVNSADWGRQIQMSFYSGPTPFAPNGKQPNKAWTFLGWNPIQSGDVAHHRSQVIEHSNDGKTIHVKCIPMQWPLDNEPGECTFESWITLDGNTAHVRSRLNNNRSDKTQYGARSQELPALYTNGPWWKLMTYKGDKPFTGDALEQMPAKMPWTGWQATENWAALVNDDGSGLGIWEPGTYQFLGGFAGKPGKGGPKDGPTGYIAPLHTDILDHNIIYDYQYTLIVGNLEEIRRYVYEHASRSTPPTWRFEHDRQHWSYQNASDTGWPIEGELKMVMEKDDPQMIGPLGFWSAADAPTLTIEAAYHADPGRAEVFWQRTDAGFGAARVVSFDAIPDGQYHRYVVNLAASPEYRGIITRLRFDPVPSGKPGEFVRIKSISLGGPR